ncbi:MAG: DUF1828 domain-containing protein [Klebsiella sp.]|jgi:hypothetical protein|uniref:DUF1828 domain-containing protein n=1 Tax=Klebsiella pneumoniae TaxID=573 RepID=UPI000D750AA5|nr:DUF1828 domain-containing protein [Klebsiella pneumoniae]PXJ08967.1 hypothetical protein DMR32_27305 [Klebsiella pneumoniae]
MGNVTCSSVISKLGFECHPMSDTLLRVVSPFTYYDDSEHISVFVQEMSGQYRITDYCDTLMNIEARGIHLTKKKIDLIRSSLASQGITLNDSGEISAWADEISVGQVTASVIRGGLLASAQTADWYAEVKDDKFEKCVISYLKSVGLGTRLALKEKVRGISGHNITVPITLKNESPLVAPKRGFTVSLSSSKGWNTAHSTVGKIVDLSQAVPEISNRFVIIDSDGLTPELQQLSLLFNDTALVLPFHSRETWIESLVA